MPHTHGRGYAAPRRWRGCASCPQLAQPGQRARPVEFGAIVIHLQHFPPPAREAILEGRRPLGTILHDHGIAHQSRPLSFIRVTSDSVMNEALHLPESQALYGRRNVIRDGDGNELANIVEILPPTEEGRGT